MAENETVNKIIDNIIKEMRRLMKLELVWPL
jgi:hypothetical protein